MPSKIIEQAIQDFIQANPRDLAEFMQVNRHLAKKYKTSLFKKSDLLRALNNKLETKKNLPAINNLQHLLKKRAVRTMSGIAPVAVLTKPYKCPGNCAYCPTEQDVPQSYLSNEPAVMRAIHCHYEPAQQVAYRLQALEANGHQPTKIELIVIGGTWSFLPTKYKYWYLASCFAGANQYPKQAKNLLSENSDLDKLKNWLKIEQKKNETAKYRLIGLTLETRPDYITKTELLQMREFGCTRVEIGVQAIDDKILQYNKRGNTVQQIKEATKLLKNYSFKVTYHLMAGLPSSTPQKDFKMYQQIFTPLEKIKTIQFNLADKYEEKKLLTIIKHQAEDNDFNPDQIKYYPTVVTTGSLLYKWWQQGKYKPYSDRVLQNLIMKIKAITPPFVRIIRIIRDIPGESIIAGNKITNLRQVLKQRGVVCNCIRCREARDKKFNLTDLILVIRKYKASGADEYFISFESKDKKTLFGFARLRLADNQDLPPNLQNYALLRELHVYGELVPVDSQTSKVQHIGLGKRLMAMAEDIAVLSGYEQMAVISGIGVKGYYRLLHYRQNKNTYMTKKLSREETKQRLK